MGQMLVNIPYMGPMGMEKLIKRSYGTSAFCKGKSSLESSGKMEHFVRAKMTHTGI